MCDRLQPEQGLEADPALLTSHLTERALDTHHVVVVVDAPEVRTVAGAEIGFVPFWLVDPLPVEVPPEVDVERAQAAALIRASETRKSRQNAFQLQSSSVMSEAAIQIWVMGKLYQVSTEKPAIME